MRFVLICETARVVAVVLFLGLLLGGAGGCARSEFATGFAADHHHSDKLVFLGPHEAGARDLAPLGDIRRELVTCTRRGRLCDPVNVVLVGTPRELMDAFTSMGWSASDPITIFTGLGMVFSTALGLPYHSAPVSTLYLGGRPQDVCFEQIVGSPRKRHHVRFWRSRTDAPDGRPIWLGAATYDSGLKPALQGLIMHRIDPNLADARDVVLKGLEAAGWLRGTSAADIRGILFGCNATGDHYFTDGKIVMGLLHPTGPKA